MLLLSENTMYKLALFQVTRLYVYKHVYINLVYVYNIYNIDLYLPSIIFPLFLKET